MADVWKSKVLPRIQKVFGGGSSKKADAAEVVKSFDESKEEISKESEEKKSELQPKVTEIYEASPAQIKALMKKPTESDLKRNSAAIKKFLEELVKIGNQHVPVPSRSSSRKSPAFSRQKSPLPPPSRVPARRRRRRPWRRSRKKRLRRWRRTLLLLLFLPPIPPPQLSLRQYRRRHRNLQRIKLLLSLSLHAL